MQALKKRKNTFSKAAAGPKVESRRGEDLDKKEEQRKVTGMIR